MKIELALLSFTLVLAVVLSVGMWSVGVVPFNAYTSTLHLASIYIGVAGVLVFQRRRQEGETHA